MKYLIIDSHKGSNSKPVSNLHWQNAKTLADTLGADLIWSYPNVNERIKKNYDVIIFNHASHYSYVDYEWVKQSPDAQLYYITNEYNLGEPRALWMAIKQAGRRYQVIANHPPEPSKIVKKYVDEWHNVNLNSLTFSDIAPEVECLDTRKGVYWGSFRKDRTPYFIKYLSDGLITVSTHIKNREKFKAVGVSGPFVNRIQWDKCGLSEYFYSLYIEDVTTHTHYNYLACRFYEALNNNIITLFGSECTGTIEKSGYYVPDCLIIDSSKQVHNVCKVNAESLFRKWGYKAAIEKELALSQICSIVGQINDSNLSRGYRNGLSKSAEANSENRLPTVLSR